VGLDDLSGKVRFSPAQPSVFTIGTPDPPQNPDGPLLSISIGCAGAVAVQTPRTLRFIQPWAMYDMAGCADITAVGQQKFAISVLSGMDQWSTADHTLTIEQPTLGTITLTTA
jgi:hypothetical protein